MTREGRKCHFAKKFTFEDYRIQLRLDWSDIKHGEPVLDADIWSISEHKWIKKGPWHHTPKTFDSSTDADIYDFKFRNLKLRLISRTTAGRNLTCRVTIVKPEQENKARGLSEGQAVLR